MNPEACTNTPYDCDPLPSTLHVVIADEDVLLREGLASLLDQRGFKVVGQAADESELLPLVREHQPDLVVIDIRVLPTRSTEDPGPATMIRQESPRTGILMLSPNVEAEHAMHVLTNEQAFGYLVKSRVTDVADVLDTLQRIAKGASVIDPLLVQELFSAPRRADPLPPLSAREEEVLALMAEGRSNAGIARRLGVALGTVEKHVRSILSKLVPPKTGDDHRRVRAVITFLQSR
jgi:DNA-binding NarL/FixJ family response regulator